MASVMTGRYSNEHGLRDPSSSANAVTMAELLHARGLHTGAIIGSFPLDSVYGLDCSSNHHDEFSMPMLAMPDKTNQMFADEISS